MLEDFDEQLVAAAVNLPIDAADLVAGHVLAIVAKLDALPDLRRGVLARVLAFDRLAAGEEKLREPAEVLQPEIFPVDPHGPRDGNGLSRFWFKRHNSARRSFRECAE